MRNVDPRWDGPVPEVGPVGHPASSRGEPPEVVQRRPELRRLPPERVDVQGRDDPGSPGHGPEQVVGEAFGPGAVGELVDPGPHGSFRLAGALRVHGHDGVPGVGGVADRQELLVGQGGTRVGVQRDLHHGEARSVQDGVHRGRGVLGPEDLQAGPLRRPRRAGRIPARAGDDRPHRPDQGSVERRRLGVADHRQGDLGDPPQVAHGRDAVPHDLAGVGQSDVHVPVDDTRHQKPIDDDVVVDLGYHGPIAELIIRWG